MADDSKSKNLFLVFTTCVVGLEAKQSIGPRVAVLIFVASFYKRTIQMLPRYIIVIKIIKCAE